MNFERILTLTRFYFDFKDKRKQQTCN